MTVTTPFTFRILRRTAQHHPGASSLLLTVLTFACLCRGQRSRDVLCSLTESEIDPVLDLESRVWTLNMTFIQTFDIQSAINCTRRGDQILLATNLLIRPRDTIIIPWNLTISGIDTQINAAKQLTSVTCPPGKALFLIQGVSASLSNLVIEKCSLLADDNVTAIIQGSRCTRRKTSPRQIQLQNVIFEENRNLVGSSGITIEDQLCYSIVMENVTFRENIFAEDSPLAQENTLVNVEMTGNRIINPTALRSSMFLFPRSSTSRLRRLTVKNNLCSTAIMENSTLIVEDSEFSNNAGIQYGVFGVKTRSLIQVTNCSFTSNTCGDAPGGALSLSESSSASLASVRFLNNSAPTAAAVHLNDPVEIRMSSCSFSRNSVRDSGTNDIGGTIIITASTSGRNTTGSISLSDCEFRESSIADGTILGIFNWPNGFVSIERSRFIGDTTLARSIPDPTLQDIDDSSAILPGNAISRTGAISVAAAMNLTFVMSDTVFDSNFGNVAGAMDFDSVSGQLNFSSTTWSRNVGVDFSQAGGVFIFALAPTVATFNNCIFDENTFTEGQGGALQALGDLTVLLLNSNFARNKGFDGGAVHFDAERLLILNCIFRRNKAINSAGAILTISSTNMLEVNNSRFVGNSAGEEGGAIRTYGQTSIDRSRFASNSAELGGAFAGSLRSGDRQFTLSSLSNSIFTSNRATAGGAVYLNGGYGVSIQNSEITRNEAEIAGGGIYAVVVRFAVTLRLNNSVLNRNEALFGGGLFGQLDFRISESPAPFSASRRIRINNSTFSRNHARRAGGGIFIDGIKGFALDCPPPGIASKAARRGSISNNFQCDRFRNNTIDDNGYGANIATTVSSFAIVINFTSTTNIQRVDEGNSHRIRNYKSGDPLPLFQVIALDELFQAGAVSRTRTVSLSSERIDTVPPSFDGFFEVNAESPGLFPSQLIANLAPGNATFVAGAPLVLPGEYEITFWTTDISRNVTVIAEIRNCTINEEIQQMGRLCTRCDSNQYNFDPVDSRCTICPENANCSSDYVLPDAGFWNAFQCSIHVQRCINPDACKGTTPLFVFALDKSRASCTLAEDQRNLYQSDLCEDEYTGPLCGACSENSGRLGVFQCRECQGTLASIVAMTTAFGILLILVILQIRENLDVVAAMSVHKMHSRLLARQILQSASRHATARSVEITEATQTDSAPRRSTGQTVQNVYKYRERTTGQRFSELLKITTNYLQTVASGAFINLSWNANVLRLLERWEFIGGAVLEATNFAVDCLLPADSTTPRSITREIVAILLPVLVLVILCTIAAAQINKRGTGFFFRRCLLTAILILYISYISLTRAAAMVFFCIEVFDGTSLVESDVAHHYWGVDTSVRCYEGSHLNFVLSLALPLLFLSLTFPISLALTLIYARERSALKSAWIQETLGIFIHGFEVEFVFWDSVILLRKGLLASVVVFSYSLGGSLQGLIAVGLLIIFLFLQTIYNPFKRDLSLLNLLESISLLISAVTILIGVILHDRMFTSEEAEVLLVVFIFFINLSFFLWLFVLLITAKIEQFKFRLLAAGIDLPSEGKVAILNTYCLYIIRSATVYIKQWIRSSEEQQLTVVTVQSRTTTITEQRQLPPQRGQQP